MEVAMQRAKGRMIFMQREQMHKLFTWEKFRVFKERKEARVAEEQKMKLERHLRAGPWLDLRNLGKEFEFFSECLGEEGFKWGNSVI